MTDSPPRRPLPAPHPAVICRPVSDGAVLLHTKDEVYYGLNTVGLLIWEGLPPVRETLTELCQDLSERFPEVPVEEIAADVRELLDELERHGLVLPAGSGEPSA